MKNMFKLAAVAISMVLAMGIVACSDSVDDVVDESTVKSFWSSKADKYVDSLGYEQNVTDAEIKSLKEAYAAITTIGDGCEHCLEEYYEKLSNTLGKSELDSKGIEDAKVALGELKTWASDENFHKVYVYKVAIKDAIENLNDAKGDVDAIDEIKYSELNTRQSASMNAYLDAAAALKAALSEADAKTCKTTIEAADKAIEGFNKLVENKNVSKANITLVTTAVEAMKDNIQTNVVDTIDSEIPIN